jgi:structural maintenance of chromosome 2
MDDLEAQLHSLNLQFNQQAVTPNSVKGLIANLIAVEKENLKYATALEIVAGGKMYFVVVDNEKTASNLLDKGQLKKRVTIIPLNKISKNNVSPDVRIGENINVENSFGKETSAR